MNNQMNWDSVFKLWQHGSYTFPKCLDEALSIESVYVEYKHHGYIYGYDWLQNEDADERKQLIAENPTEFLYFTKPSNKGTIQTAQMLVEAQDTEEMAAIWIAATAFELMNKSVHSGVARYANELYYAAIEFLRNRFYLWHHAMRKLVPEIMIPYSVLDSLRCEQAEALIGLIQMNVIMLKGSYTLLHYSSISEDELKDERLHSLRL